ncbi:MAG: DUF4363 family protein [Bacillota bacterium]|jgi:predicted PurR-regulated permease PerM
MRFYITLVVLLILILALGIFNQVLLAKSTDTVTANFNQIYREINNENWAEAQNKIKISKNHWEKHKNWWSMVINHQEIDNIESSFSKISEYIKYHDKALSSGELIVLKQFLEHIPEKEKITFKNIL